jgi:hypothetical protein
MDIHECRLCLEEVNSHDFPFVVQPCSCNAYYHRECYKKVMHSGMCSVCQTSFIELPEITETAVHITDSPPPYEEESGDNKTLFCLAIVVIIGLFICMLVI